ncbi:TIGR02147 family protein, partial [bacterium]|nr:TIGR02147 family protein [bacterium]
MSVYEYNDYRAFLVDHARRMQGKQKRWSYGAWAKRLGLKTTSSITKVVQGQRTPGDKLTESLVGYFRFDPTEAAHFRDLVRLQRFKKDPRLCQLLEDRIPSGKRSTSRLLTTVEFTRLYRWYYLVLR